MTNAKKGQAAIEFLITYGWAIMASMLVIGALAYFGMSNPATSLPDKCIFSNNFECKDYRVTSTTLNLQLVNIAGQTIFGSPISAKITDTGVACSVAGNPTLLDPEGQISITCGTLPNSPLDTKDKVKIKITITYATISGGYSHISLGELYTTVQ